MFNRKTVALILVVGFFAANAGLARTVEENWNDFLHYTTIARLDLARGYAQTLLDSDPDPVALLALSEENLRGYNIILRLIDSAPKSELAELSGKIIEAIEKGRFIRRSNSKIIIAEIKRLNTTERGWLTAVERLRNAGEYAIPHMLDVMAAESRKQELPNLIRALPEVGRDAIRPLAAALQTKNVPLKAEIIKALGKIGYPQSLAYLQYVVENEESDQLRELAGQSIKQIDPAASDIPATQLFYRLAENYYYHTESFAPAEDADFANIWFFNTDNQRLARHEVNKNYFYELMAMRACEWALKADAAFGRAIGLWQAAFFKAESTGVEKMPDYFGTGHAQAIVYATTAGPEYLHQALARAVKDKNTYVALGTIEALATTAGEKSLLYRLGIAQPLLQALSFDNKAVRYSAAIAIAAAGPKEHFAERILVTENLAQALGETDDQADTALKNRWVTESYAVRAAKVMLKLAETENPVIDLTTAQAALINATKDQRTEIQVLAGRILARLPSPDAQRSTAAMALDESNSMNVRVAAFDSLAVSAKFNANLLTSSGIEAIYSLVGSQQADPQLRSAAARAYGAFDLPSRKAKDLILDQAKT